MLHAGRSKLAGSSERFYCLKRQQLTDRASPLLWATELLPIRRLCNNKFDDNHEDNDDNN